MLTIDDFNKAEDTQSGLGERVIKMTPKEPVAGLDGLEVFVFLTRFIQGSYRLWAWDWRTRKLGWWRSSLGKEGWPEETHYNLESAADAAIKDLSYRSDDERLPREERERQERESNQERLDNRIKRFLES